MKSSKFDVQSPRFLFPIARSSLIADITSNAKIQVRATALVQEFGVPICKIHTLKDHPDPSQCVLLLGEKRIMLLEFVSGNVGTIDGITNQQLLNVGSCLGLSLLDLLDLFVD